MFQSPHAPLKHPPYPIPPPPPPPTAKAPWSVRKVIRYNLEWM